MNKVFIVLETAKEEILSLNAFSDLEKAKTYVREAFEFDENEIDDLTTYGEYENNGWKISMGTAPIDSLSTSDFFSTRKDLSHTFDKPEHINESGWDMVCKNLKTNTIEPMGHYSSRKAGVEYAPEGLDQWLEDYAHCDDIDEKDDLIGDFMQYQGKKAIKCGDYVFFLAPNVWDAYGNLKSEPTIPEIVDRDSVINESEVGNWFDKYGNMVRPLPKECVDACAAGGRVDDEVEYWVNELKFEEGLPMEDAKRYIQSTGGWDKEEIDEMSDHDIAMKVLWIMCGYIKDYQNEDEEDYSDYLPNIKEY